LGRTTLTEATGVVAAVDGVTVRVALPLFEALVAMMSTVPGDIAITRPEAETVATVLLLVLQVTGWFSI